VTTNCVLDPLEAYRKNIFTTGAVRCLPLLLLYCLHSWSIRLPLRLPLRLLRSLLLLVLFICCCCASSCAFCSRHTQHALQAYQVGPGRPLTRCVLWVQTGVAGVEHIKGKDFSPVVARALELPGFTAEGAAAIPAKEVTVGFGHKAVLGVAGQVIDAVQQGKLEHIFLIGG
jgi:hydroxylamine reductase (hybrid-cluster protein)